MAIPKPITRVEQYLAHISGMRVNVPEVPLTREEMYLASWAKKSGIEDAEMQGDPPLTLKDCIGEPFKGLVLYGKSTQVTTTGAQLLDKDALINGIIDLSSGVIYSNNAWVVSDFIPVSDLSNYCISQENEVFFQCRIGCYDASKNKITADEKSGNVTFFTFSTPEATKYIRIGYSTQLSGSSVDRGNIMLNAGDTALPWEPYTGGKPSPSPDYPQEIMSAGDDGNLSVIVKNPDNEQMQSVSFSTPNGLPGIPVSSGGNYTDSNGQQWICDELDFERGVYRQRINCKEYLDASGWKHSITSKFKNHNFQTRLSNSDASVGINGRCYCNLLSYQGPSWDDLAVNLPKIYAYNTEITASFPPDTNMDSIEKWDELLKKTPLQIQYILETTIETPLSETDIAAYRALTTYRGTTILESECGLKVKYSKLLRK